MKRIGFFHGHGRILYRRIDRDISIYSLPEMLNLAEYIFCELLNS
jgi:hypothetical protein